MKYSAKMLVLAFQVQRNGILDLWGDSILKLLANRIKDEPGARIVYWSWPSLMAARYHFRSGSSDVIRAGKCFDLITSANGF